MGTGQLSTGEFLEQLITRVSPAYAIFREGAAGAIKLVDVMVAEKLDVPEGFAVRAAMGDEALRAWGASVEGAKPYRNAMQLIVDSFPAWWQSADDAGRAGLAEHLPMLAPAVADLGDAGVRDLLAAGPAALRGAAAYALADAKAVRAIGSVAKAGRNEPERCAEVLDALRAAFPVSMIEDSREAERLLPALGKAVDAAGDGWAEAVELAAVLLANDASSAYGVMESLPKSLAQAPDKKLYLAHFVALVRALGNRAAGVCLKRLPGGKAGVAEEAVTLASQYGVLAAERYLEEQL